MIDNVYEITQQYHSNPYDSGRSKIYHCKFMMDLVQAPIVEQGTEIEIKVQSHHSTDKICPNFLKDISPQEYHQHRKKSLNNTKLIFLGKTLL